MLKVDEVADDCVETHVEQQARPEYTARALSDVSILCASIPNCKDEKLDQKESSASDGNHLSKENVSHTLPATHMISVKDQREEEGKEAEDEEELQIEVELADGAMTLLPGDCLSVAGRI